MTEGEAHISLHSSLIVVCLKPIVRCQCTWLGFAHCNLSPFSYWSESPKCGQWCLPGVSLTVHSLSMWMTASRNNYMYRMDAWIHQRTDQTLSTDCSWHASTLYAAAWMEIPHGDCKNCDWLLVFSPTCFWCWWDLLRMKTKTFSRQITSKQLHCRPSALCYRTWYIQSLLSCCMCFIFLQTLIWELNRFGDLAESFPAVV